MWNTGAGSSSGGSKEAFIREGNVDFLVFKEEKLRVTPLTQSVDVEMVMSNNKMTREQAMEHIYTEIASTMWVNPKAYWEHSVPTIPQVRFFSTIPCQGRMTCICCVDNGNAEAQGVTENKMKPFPVRKKFIIPVWVYSLNRVLFIRQNEKYINAMGEYINQFGDAIDFDVWRTGKGFGTEYHCMYLGQRQSPVEKVEMLLPNQIDLTVPDEEIRKRIGNKSAGARGTPIQQNQNAGYQQSAQQSTPPQNSNFPTQPLGQNSQVNEPNVGQYMLPFGNYKGQSLESIYQSGDLEYLKFLKDQGAGLVKDKVTEFLAGKGEQ